MTNWAVNPLDRTCTEVPVTRSNAHEGGRLEKAESPRIISIGELAQFTAFILLGEPGMGKSSVMKALATRITGSPAIWITADDFIVQALEPQQTIPEVFIDALDEARASGDNGVWRALRTRLAQARPQRLGIACRRADWLNTDASDIEAVVPDRAVRVFSLDPLTPEQARAVLSQEKVADIDGFEQQAQSLGFGDMLGNPQSLKLLAAAVRGNAHQFPQTRHEAHEMACRQLVEEPNERRRQARALAPLQGIDPLLNAAGWLCALQLLSNATDISEEPLTATRDSSVRLVEVLGHQPLADFSEATVQQVLHRRVFAKPRGYAASHRTVAEYLAGRYLARRIAQGDLSPSRVSALLLATPQHLVSNLRGLGGWLASLSEPMRAAIFNADPAAVLDHGDLSVLPTAAKHALIEQLSTHPRTGQLSNVWQKAKWYVPLVSLDMIDGVVAWFNGYRAARPKSPSQTAVAYVLLNALQHVLKDALWVSPLVGLLRDEGVYIGVRDSALDALIVHAAPDELLALLEDLHDGTMQDQDGRLIGSLLQHLYPEHVRPVEVLRFLKTSVSLRQSTAYRVFWNEYLARLTPQENLQELMGAMLHTLSPSVVASLSAAPYNHSLDGLATLTVKAITLLGNTVPVETLASWIKLCTDQFDSPFGRLRPELYAQLAQWMKDRPAVVTAVLSRWVDQGDTSWAAQNRIPSSGRPEKLGRFWFQQALLWDKAQDAKKTCECLVTAVGWLEQGTGDLTLEDLEQAAASSSTFGQALTPMLSTTLKDNDWRRENARQDRRYRESEISRDALNDQNRRYLLDHLESIQNGRLLTYLSAAAWTDLRDDGYGGMEDGEQIAQWREAHPELDVATREGYQTLLIQLTAAQAEKAVLARSTQEILNIELPCLVAAQQLFSEQPDRFFALHEEGLKALITLHLLNHSRQHNWFLALLESHPKWVEGAWWKLGQRQLRAKPIVRVPRMDLLRHELAGRTITARLLSRTLAAWPSKFSELNFAEFATLLEEVVRQCPAPEVSRLIQGRLQHKSLGSLQKAYLLMAGFWVDHAEFAPQLENDLSKRQIVQTELLGFIGYLRRYGGEPQPLPAWDASTLLLLFRLFAPICSPDYPEGAYSPNVKDAGRGFLYQVLASLRDDTSEAARQSIAILIEEPKLIEWKSQLQGAASRQAQARAERSFAAPTARQVALTLQSKAPANPADLMAVALDALGELQREIYNHPSSLINDFWTVDSNGKHPLPPNRPESACRDVIARWLAPRLSALSVTVLPELQHGDQKRSDLGLLVHNAGAPEMLLPIEVKGDWHEKLWEAAHQQLGEQYATDCRCWNQGVYLVLWTGDLSRLRQLPNYQYRVTTPQELQRQLQQREDERGGMLQIRVMVLDLSIPSR